MAQAHQNCNQHHRQEDLAIHRPMISMIVQIFSHACSVVYVHSPRIHKHDDTFLFAEFCKSRFAAVILRQSDVHSWDVITHSQCALFRLFLSRAFFGGIWSFLCRGLTLWRHRCVFDRDRPQREMGVFQRQDTQPKGDVLVLPILVEIVRKIVLDGLNFVRFYRMASCLHSQPHVRLRCGHLSLDPSFSLSLSLSLWPCKFLATTPVLQVVPIGCFSGIKVRWVSSLQVYPV